MDHSFQDPTCRARDKKGHRCVDKHGDWFASPQRAARPGSVCWYEQLSRLEDERRQARAELEEFRRWLDHYGEQVAS